MKKLYKDYEKIVRMEGVKEGEEKGFKKGEEKGLKKGLKEGRDEGKLSMAADMVEANAMPLSKVASFTGHSEEELRQFIASRKLKPA